MAKNKYIPDRWKGGRCPDNTVTYSWRKYIRAWRELIDVLEEFTGLKVLGFDPGFSLAKVEGGKIIPGTSIQIPAWFARDITLDFANKKHFKEKFTTLTVMLERNQDNRVILHDLASVDVMDVIDTYVKDEYHVTCDDFMASGCGGRDKPKGFSPTNPKRKHD